MPVKPEHFQISLDNDRIILAPQDTGRADAVRDKLAALDISEDDIADAVAGARQK